jgi:protocatechuate 3,4-dioxygenase beta subunit
MRKGAAVFGLAMGLAILQPCALGEEIKPYDASAGGPTRPPSHITVAPDAEPGERLILSGRIFGNGRRPMAGARLYLYHTDAGGVYSSRGVRYPRLRGWLETGPDGRYEFKTIRPGHYPGRRVPAHIHATLRAPGHAERWIDDYWFEGDPYLGPKERARATGKASFSPIVRVERGPNGVWRGTRDLRLEP